MSVIQARAVSVCKGISPAAAPGERRKEGRNGGGVGQREGGKITLECRLYLFLSLLLFSAGYLIWIGWDRNGRDPRGMR